MQIAAERSDERDAKLVLSTANATQMKKKCGVYDEVRVVCWSRGEGRKQKGRSAVFETRVQASRFPPLGKSAMATATYLQARYLGR